MLGIEEVNRDGMGLWGMWAGRRGEAQGKGGRVPFVWKDAVLHQYGEASENLQGVGPWGWTKVLTEPEM